MKKWILASLFVALATPTIAGTYIGNFTWSERYPAYPVKSVKVNLDIEQIGTVYASNGIALVEMFNGDILGGMCTGTIGVSDGDVLMDNMCGPDNFTFLLNTSLNGRYLIRTGDVNKATGNINLK